MSAALQTVRPLPPSGSVAGLDLGSRYVKLVACEDGLVTRSERIETAAFYRRFLAGGGAGIDVASLGLPSGTVLVATGYGRNLTTFSGSQVVPELRALVAGAIAMTGLDEFMQLDLGGQDSKAISVREGRMVSFQTNDKCAASSGRYLENMAAVLGMSLDELSGCRLHPVELDSTCSTFGETELIALMAEGEDVQRLAAGVNRALFQRSLALLSRESGSGPLVFTGGVAANAAIAGMLREAGYDVVLPEGGAFAAAVGCCFLFRPAP